MGEEHLADQMIALASVPGVGDFGLSVIASVIAAPIVWVLARAINGPPSAAASGHPQTPKSSKQSQTPPSNQRTAASRPASPTSSADGDAGSWVAVLAVLILSGVAGWLLRNHRTLTAVLMVLVPVLSLVATVGLRSSTRGTPEGRVTASYFLQFVAVCLFVYVAWFTLRRARADAFADRAFLSLAGLGVVFFLSTLVIAVLHALDERRPQGRVSLNLLRTSNRMLQGNWVSRQIGYLVGALAKMLRWSWNGVMRFTDNLHPDNPVVALLILVGPAAAVLGQVLPTTP